MVAEDAAAGGGWFAWEPEEWVRARGRPHTFESAHFAVRWGGEGAEAERASRAAVHVCEWLERCWARLCSPDSADFFVLPYSAEGWCADGVMPRRKINVYIGDKLAPHPGVGWAHQGTYVEHGVATVRHHHANQQGKLHHSYLALGYGAAENERTVCHEFAHALQMHTGGHVDSRFVGYQWEAHAEYCTHLLRPDQPSWAPHLRRFLETSNLPIDCTNAADDGQAGRQYIVWPFYCFLDSRFGRGFVHRLWHVDRMQRQAHGCGSLDMLSNLASTGEGADWLMDVRKPGETGSAFLSRIFADFALASLTLHWGWSAEQHSALHKAASPLLPSRFTRLRRLCRPSSPPPFKGAVGWRPDAARPLKRLGSHAFRVEPCAGAQQLRLVVRWATSSVPGEIRLAVVCMDVRTCEQLAVAGPEGSVRVGGRSFSHSETIGASVEGSQNIMEASLCVNVVRRTGVAYLATVCAGTEDFAPCEWGTKPSTLATAKYTVWLSGCEPHTDCEVLKPPAPARTLAIPLSGKLQVPTGLANLQPKHREGGGGASLTGRDVRSGSPHQTNDVLLNSELSVDSSVHLRAITFAYRWLCGYSTNKGSPGPRFEIQLLRTYGDCADDEEVDDDATTLYESPEVDATPYSFDAATGGHPQNYSPASRVTAPLDILLPPGRYNLRLRFRNGRRNMHLQGADLARKCDLNLQLEFGDDQRIAPLPTPTATAHAEEALAVEQQQSVQLLLDALPDRTCAQVRSALAIHGWNADVAAASLLGIQDI